jgi:hypothetical protein
VLPTSKNEEIVKIPFRKQTLLGSHATNRRLSQRLARTSRVNEDGHERGRCRSATTTCGAEEAYLATSSIESNEQQCWSREVPDIELWSLGEGWRQ